MKIGITYDLRDEYLKDGFTEEETAEFDRADTIESIENALKQLGHDTDRIGNICALAGRLVQGDRWDLVFNIAEGLYGIGREAQVPAILDAYAIPYTFSDPVVMGVTLQKAFTKSILRDAGLPTPDFVQVNRVEQVAEVGLAFPLFAKPVAEGTGKGITPASVIASAEELIQCCADLLERFEQPVLVERFLPGREVTVGIVGTDQDAQALGTLEVVLRSDAEENVYSYVNKERCEELVEYILVEDPGVTRPAEALALAAWRALGCRDAGRVDLRADENGQFQLLEINPLAGIHPEHSDLPMLATKVGISYGTLIDRIIRSASRRISSTQARGPA